jgi:hypothetical protein
MIMTVLIFLICVGNFSPAMEARNQVGIRLSYRPASLCSLATQFQTRFLELIPRPIAGLKIPSQVFETTFEEKQFRLVFPACFFSK